MRQAFCLCAWTRKKPQKKRWRIPERTLLGVAALGGSVGVLLGMYTFRHKTKHRKFTLGVPAILLAQLLLLAHFYA